jgi:hypothetical protein
MELATVCCYRLPGDIKIEETQQTTGNALWAVRRGGACLNCEGQWEYEPMPSSRDSQFLARCRWSTPESAYAAWQHNPTNIENI